MTAIIATMKYLVVVEKSGNGFGAYVPDLPGCVAVADTREEVVTLIQEAIEFHIEGASRNPEIPCHSRPLKASWLTYMLHDESAHWPSYTAHSSCKWATERPGTALPVS